MKYQHQVRFTGISKIYQQSLVQLMKRATNKEKNAIKKITKQFLCNILFQYVWKTLNKEIQEKILNTAAGDKGIIPYKNNFILFSSLD